METKYVLLIAGGTVILSILVILIIVFIILYQKRYYKYLKEKQQMEVLFGQTLLQSQIEIQEQTLQNISHEIHDNFGQVASLIKINLNTININDKEKAIEKISDTKDLTKQLISDVKALSVSLSNGRITKIGLLKALEIEVNRLNKIGNIKVQFIKNNSWPNLTEQVSVLLYRMVQEILNNILKHAQANEIIISITNSLKKFTLAVCDNGLGFDVNEKLNSEDGAGLTNLKKRAAYINANLLIESTLHEGTKITIELPL